MTREPHIIAQEIIDEIEPMDDSNSRRAARALLCVMPDYNDGTAEENIRDVLCDLIHLCDLAGFDWTELYERARRITAEERHEALTSDHPELAAAIKEHLS